MPRRKIKGRDQTEKLENPPSFRVNAALDQEQSRSTIIKFTLRLLHDSDNAMGPGKADLLETIMQTGSITAAG